MQRSPRARPRSRPRFLQLRRTTRISRRPRGSWASPSTATRARMSGPLSRGCTAARSFQPPSTLPCVPTPLGGSTRPPASTGAIRASSRQSRTRAGAALAGPSQPQRPSSRLTAWRRSRPVARPSPSPSSRLNSSSTARPTRSTAAALADVRAPRSPSPSSTSSRRAARTAIWTTRTRRAMASAWPEASSL